MAIEDKTTKSAAWDEVSTPWMAALNKLREWDPAWAEECIKMTTQPWTEGALSTKLIELVCIGLNAIHFNPHPDGTRRHIRAAIAAGASRQEILFVLKCAAVMAIHSSCANAPILLREASSGSLKDFSAVRAKRLKKTGEVTAAVEKMKAIGQWSEEWDAVLFLAPVWTDEYMAMCTALYAENALTRKELELLLIALDASNPQSSHDFVRRHIGNAFRAGATTDEIIQVLKLAVVLRVQASNVGVTILAEELERNTASQHANA